VLAPIITAAINMLIFFGFIKRLLIGSRRMVVNLYLMTGQAPLLGLIFFTLFNEAVHQAAA